MISTENITYPKGENVFLNIFWRDECRTGLRIFDDQHKILFRLLDNLVFAINTGAEKSLIVDTYEKYVEFKMLHIVEEELAMRACSFSDYKAHSAEHEEFAWRLTSYHDYIRNSPAPAGKDIIDFIVSWQQRHIEEWDIKCGMFIKGIGGAIAPFLKWDEKYTVGISKIDAQHKEIFRLIRLLYNGVMFEKKISPEIFDNLLDVVTQHFTDEERKMISVDYPFFMKHKEEHDMLFNEAVAFHELYIASEVQANVDIVWFLASWAKNHMATSDKEFFRYLKAFRGADGAMGIA